MAKKKKKKIGCLSFLLIPIFLFLLIVQNAQKNQIDIKKEYIESTKDLAIEVSNQYGLFPSVTLAQSALESNYGRSKLSSEYNNYFGIKGKKDTVALETEEYINGKSVKQKENFRKYKSKKDSFYDYGNLIGSKKRYKKVLQAKTYKEAIGEIKAAGYAADPKYAEKVIRIIEKYKLNDLDISFKK